MPSNITNYTCKVISSNITNYKGFSISCKCQWNFSASLLSNKEHIQRNFIAPDLLCYQYVTYLFALYFIRFTFFCTRCIKSIFIEVSSLLKLFLCNLSNLKWSRKLTLLCQGISYDVTKVPMARRTLYHLLLNH